MSHNQLDRMLEYHAVFCHTLQYFVTLVSTLSHCAILCHTVQYFVTLCNTSAIVCHPTHSPCHREQGGSENRRKPSLWTLGKRQPCDLQEVCGLHLERKGKVSGWLCRNAFAILVQYFCNTSLHTKKKVRSLWVRMQTVVRSSLTGSCLSLVSSANMSTHNLQGQSGTWGSDANNVVWDIFSYMREGYIHIIYSGDVRGM